MDSQPVRRNFEQSLVDVLAQDYDLPVRHATDPLERRRKDLLTLCFSYKERSGPEDTEVVVEVQGRNGFACGLRVDLSSSSRAERSAEDCIDLAAALRDLLDEGPPPSDETGETRAVDGHKLRRRWDDV